VYPIINFSYQMNTSKNPANRFILLAAMIAVIDLLLKVIVTKTLEPTEHHEWLGGLIGIGRIQNVRMAFGFREGYLIIDIVKIVFQIIFVLIFLKIQRIQVNKLFNYSSTLIVFGWLDHYTDKLLLANGTGGYVFLSYINVNNSFTDIASIMIFLGWTLLIIAILSKFSDFKLVFKKRTV
jgi:hypothetical protein